MEQLKRIVQNKYIKGLLIALISVFVIAFIGYSAILIGGKRIVKEEKFILPEATIIETVDGEIVGELYEERRYPVTIEQIPEHVKQAFIAVEDRRFYDHSGVDFRSVLRAVYRDIIARDKAEGASTITQQLAKNLFLSHEKTWMRKTKEVMAAIYLERNYTKDDILELYLNKIYFGDGLHGIEAASQRFFSKSVRDLTISEAALLAGIIQRPNYYSPERHPERAKQRRNVVLQTMERAEFISAETMLREQGKTLGLNIQERNRKPWNESYLDLVIKEVREIHQFTMDELRRGGYRIIVNIDERIQKTAYDHFQKEEYFPGSTEGVEASFIMIDQKTGRIVSALGGRDYTLGDLNRVFVKRQPGSTIKPLVAFGPALMKEGYHPYVLLPDEAIEYDGYVVSNVDGKYDGQVTLYDSVVQSKNAPTVWLYNELGAKESKAFLEKMNINIEDEGLPVALGGLTEGMTPLDLVKGFSAFSNDGKAVEPYTIERMFDREKELIYEANIVQYDVFTPQVAWYMTEMLQQAVTSGTGRPGEYPKALAGKTGTTEHPRAKGIKDAWFVGYTPEYTSAVWMGYDISDENHYLTGGSPYATRLMKDILSSVDQKIGLGEQFIKPEYVEALPEPIELREINDVKVSYTFGGFPFIKGKLVWESDNDERVIYRIYEQQKDGSKLIDEVPGSTREYIIDRVPILKKSFYYVVPINPFTEEEGSPSIVAELSL